MKAVHYLNQFFAGMGGEEHAETPPTRLDGSAGPGKVRAGNRAHIGVPGRTTGAERRHSGAMRYA